MKLDSNDAQCTVHTTTCTRIVIVGIKHTIRLEDKLLGLTFFITSLVSIHDLHFVIINFKWSLTLNTTVSLNTKTHNINFCVRRIMIMLNRK